ncbi:hypothetical protein J7643_15955 [bacterium]|nr:hypothetical protein [bacterium]
MKFPLLLAATMLGVTACAATPTALQQAPVGSARLVMGLQDQRQVQYTLGADVKAIKVTVTESSNGQVAENVFSGAGLTSKLSGNTFSFTVNNLLVGDLARPSYSYTAVVRAYLDAAATTPIGSSTSTAFSVTNAQTSNISLPNLLLNATPQGNEAASVEIIDNAPAAVTIN